MNTQLKHESVSLITRIKNALKRKGRMEDFTRDIPVFPPGRGPLQPHSSWEVMPPQPPKSKDEEKPRDY